MSRPRVVKRMTKAEIERYEAMCKVLEAASVFEKSISTSRRLRHEGYARRKASKLLLSAKTLFSHVNDIIEGRRLG